MAVVRLAPGEVAYYDPVTRIHLTLANPTSGVPEWYDLSGLRRAHAVGVVVLDEAPRKAVTEDAAGVFSEAPPQVPVAAEIVVASELQAETVRGEVEQAAVVADELGSDVESSGDVGQVADGSDDALSPVEQPRNKRRKKTAAKD